MSQGGHTRTDAYVLGIDQRRALTVAEGSYMGVGGGEVFYYLQNLMKFECAARSTSQSFYNFADISLDLEKMLPYTPSLHARMRGK